MRISFPNGEHTDVALAGGELSIGSAAGNGLVLAAEGITPRHAVIRLDSQRGILLDVLGPNASVYVNGREIQQFALLRLGDVLSLGRVQVLLKPDREDSIVVQVPPSASNTTDETQRAAASRVVLRGVAGSFFGRSVSLEDKVTVGRSAKAQIRLDDPEIPDIAGSFEIQGDRVVFRDLGTVDGAVVNGVAVRNAILHPGDQIAIDVHRFVLEAPGLPARGADVDAEAPAPGSHMGSTQTLRAVTADDAAQGGKVNADRGADADGDDAGTGWGWLLLAAAAIAAALTALFLYGPRS